ncbi:MAG: site-2 protease family protein, partial [Thermomicrobiales bacterium]
MSWSFNLFRVRGIQIRVHATFALILIWAAYFWGNGADDRLRGAVFGIVATLILFACVTLHELGHSFQAMAFGIPVKDVTLYPIGGVARIEGIPDDPKKEFRIAIAGPAVNLAIAAALIAVAAVLGRTSVLSPGNLSDSMRGATWQGLLPYVTVANIWLALFNLLPAFPMDGGRILRAVLAMRMGRVRATTIAMAIGQGMALLFGLYGFTSGNFFLVVIAVFGWMGAGQEGQAVVVQDALAGVVVGDVMSRAPQTLTPFDPLRRAVELTLSTSQSDFPVVDGRGLVVGMLSIAELVHGLHDRPQSAVGEVMRGDLPIIRPD